MTNSELFKRTFGRYATEVWALPEDEFLEWLNADVHREAFDMAIQVLEQEPILEKIRAEIDQKQYDFMDDKDYDEGIRFGLMLAYQIIDKYRAESEGNDNEDIPMEYFESGGRVLKND